MHNVRHATRRADPSINIPESAFGHIDPWHTGSVLDVIAAGVREVYADLLRQPVPPRFTGLWAGDRQSRRGGTRHDA
jgi:hypothetical protein